MRFFQEKLAPEPPPCPCCRRRWGCKCTPEERRDALTAMARYGELRRAYWERIEADGCSGERFISRYWPSYTEIVPTAST